MDFATNGPMIPRIIWSACFRHDTEIKLSMLLKSDFRATYLFIIDIYNYRHIMNTLINLNRKMIIYCVL